MRRRLLLLTSMCLFILLGTQTIYANKEVSISSEHALNNIQDDAVFKLNEYRKKNEFTAIK